MQDKTTDGARLARFQCEIPASTKAAVEKLFERQGLITKEGTTRAFNWLLKADPRIWPIVFQQVDDETGQELLKIMLKRPKKKG